MASDDGVEFALLRTLAEVNRKLLQVLCLLLIVHIHSWFCVSYLWLVVSAYRIRRHPRLLGVSNRPLSSVQLLCQMANNMTKRQ